MFIYAYNAHSEGAIELASKLPAKRIKHENSNFRGGPLKTVINWGCSGALPAEVLKCRILNKPDNIRLASNKLHFFRKVDDSLLPPWTESFDEAVAWCGNGKVVCARTVLNGHSAEGLVLMEPSNPNTFVQAQLYTQYVPKKDEYRIHVVKGEVIDCQKKVLKQDRAQEAANGGPPVEWRVRNLGNGFIYQRNGIEIPLAVKEAAIKAMNQIGLDFGGVDIIYRKEGNDERALVLEINTAPGVQGTTADNYAKAFRNV